MRKSLIRTISKLELELQKLEQERAVYKTALNNSGGLSVSNNSSLGSLSFSNSGLSSSSGSSLDLSGSNNSANINGKNKYIEDDSDEDESSEYTSGSGTLSDEDSDTLASPRSPHQPRKNTKQIYNNSNGKNNDIEKKISEISVAKGASRIAVGGVGRAATTIGTEVCKLLFIRA